MGLRLVMCQSCLTSVRKHFFIIIFFFYTYFSLSEKYLQALRALATGRACSATIHVLIDKDHTTKQGGVGSSWDGRRQKEEEGETCWRRERGVKTREECGAKMNENIFASQVFGCILTVVSIAVLYSFLCLGFYRQFLSALCSRVVFQAS